MGVWVNLLLHERLVYFQAEVMLRPDDPRHAGKAIPIRNLMIADYLTSTARARRLWWKRRHALPR
jgi:hypothetical protein